MPSCVQAGVFRRRQGCVVRGMHERHAGALPALRNACGGQTEGSPDAVLDEGASSRLAIAWVAAPVALHN
jgi:hypothetical protein